MLRGFGVSRVIRSADRMASDAMEISMSQQLAEGLGQRPALRKCFKRQCRGDMSKSTHASYSSDSEIDPVVSEIGKWMG